MKKQQNRENLIFISLLTLLALVLVGRAFFGFHWSDENFYLTFTDRMLKGERLILDEWHPAQFYSVILLPFAALYQAVMGKTGIYLFFRLLYILFSWLTGLTLYRGLKTVSRPLTAFLAAALYMVYSRANIWGVSYYNLFLTCAVAAAGLLLLAADRDANRQLLCGFAGFLLALAVLCMPYFAPFLILALAVCLIMPRGRKPGIWCLSGMALAAVIFVVFFLPKDISGVMTNLKSILSDPEHDAGPLSNFVDVVEDVIVIYWRFAMIAAGMFLVRILLRFFLKSKNWEWGYSAAAVLVMAYAAWKFRMQMPGFGLYPAAMLCLPWLLDCWAEKRIQRSALYIRLLGIASALSFALGSNTFADAPTVGILIYCIGLLVQLDAFFGEKEMAPGRAGVVAVMVLAIGCTLFSRIGLVYRDGNLPTLNTRLTDGPAAGIFTTEAHADQYRKLLMVMDGLNAEFKADNHIFVTKLAPWVYVASDFHYGVSTAWRTPLDSPRLLTYYTDHPDSIPDLVVVLADEVGFFDKELPNENTRSGWLWDYMQSHNYTSEKTEFAEIFISPAAERKE